MKRRQEGTKTGPGRRGALAVMLAGALALSGCAAGGGQNGAAMTEEELSETMYRVNISVETEAEVNDDLPGDLAQIRDRANAISDNRAQMTLLEEPEETVDHYWKVAELWIPVDLSAEDISLTLRRLVIRSGEASLYSDGQELALSRDDFEAAPAKDELDPAIYEVYGYDRGEEYLKLTLDATFAAVNRSALLGVGEVRLLLNSDLSDPANIKLAPGPDPAVWYVFDNELTELEMQALSKVLTEPVLAHGFFMSIISPTRWEKAEGNEEAGAFQQERDYFGEQDYCELRYSVTAGDKQAAIRRLKGRLDVLETPYALGEIVSEQETILLLTGQNALTKREVDLLEAEQRNLELWCGTSVTTLPTDSGTLTCRENGDGSCTLELDLSEKGRDYVSLVTGYAARGGGLEIGISGIRTPIAVTTADEMVSDGRLTFDTDPMTGGALTGEAAVLCRMLAEIWEEPEGNEQLLYSQALDVREDGTYYSSLSEAMPQALMEEILGKLKDKYPEAEAGFSYNAVNFFLNMDAEKATAEQAAQAVTDFWKAIGGEQSAFSFSVNLYRFPEGETGYAYVDFDRGPRMIHALSATFSGSRLDPLGKEIKALLYEEESLAPLMTNSSFSISE